MAGVQSVVMTPVPAGEIPPAQTGRAGRAVSGLAGFVSRHWLFLLALLGGIVIRMLVTVAYWPAFWFQADSRMYINASAHLRPGVYGGANGLGYPAVLKLLSVTHSLAVVALLQHLVVLGLAVLSYVFLRRRGLPGWLATVATLPTLFDARQVGLEHYILSDTLFLILLTGAFLLLAWWDRPGYPACVLAGLMLSAAAVTRTVGVGVLGIVAGYLLVRRVGFRRIVVFALSCLVAFGGYLAWNHAETGSFALASKPGKFLYSRTAQIADCSRLRLTDAQRELCPDEPLGARPERGDYYIWNDHSVAKAPDALAGSFAKAVIDQQPWDYAKLVLHDTGRYLLPGMSMGPATTCLAGWSMLPADPSRKPPLAWRCMPFIASGDGFSADPVPPARTEHNNLQDFLHGYSKWVYTPHAALGLGVLLAVLALFWRPRHGRWRDGLDAALFAGTALAMLVVGVSTSLYSIRYGIPPITLIAIGGTLALYRLHQAFTTPRQAAIADGPTVELPSRRDADGRH